MYALVMYTTKSPLLPARLHYILYTQHNEDNSIVCMGHSSAAQVGDRSRLPRVIPVQLRWGTGVGYHGSFQCSSGGGPE